MSKKKNISEADEEITSEVISEEVDETKIETKPDTGFSCYIGPTLLGVIQNGSIFSCSRDEAVRLMAAAIAKHPGIASLIISGDDLPEARIKVKTPGTLLFHQYKQIASGKN